ncbi:hypothetical protein AAHE18_12G217200 [Arachis hypogaea]
MELRFRSSTAPFFPNVTTHTHTHTHTRIERRSGGRKGVATTPRRGATTPCRRTHPAATTNADEERWFVTERLAGLELPSRRRGVGKRELAVKRVRRTKKRSLRLALSPSAPWVAVAILASCHRVAITELQHCRSTPSHRVSMVISVT